VLRKLEELERGQAPDPEMRAVAPLFALQRRLSRVPATGTLLVERVRVRGAEHAFVFPFEGRAVHEALAALVAWRLARASPRSITTTVDDYGFELVTHDSLPDTADEWRALLAHERWLEDLLACLNTTELARRRFREIARIAGLVFQGQPGKPKTTRQIQASSGLLYDVFARYDPENLLLDQARREVLENELEARRLAGALERIAAVEIAVEHPARLTPISFRLWADSARNEVSSESWETRVRRMAAELEAAVEPEPARDARGPSRNAARRVAR
jgi:ATP-dependent Lhr-like helicase